MLIRVLVNETFRDKHNPKKKLEKGKTYTLEVERVREIKETKATLITELGVVPSSDDEEKVPNEEPVKVPNEEPVKVPNEEPVEDSKKEQKK